MTRVEQRAFWEGFRRGWLRTHLVLLPAWLWVLSMILSACRVYEPPCACRQTESAGHGVTVRFLAAADGGAE